MEAESAKARSLPAKECVPRGMAFDSSGFRDCVCDPWETTCGLGPPGGRNPLVSDYEVRFLRLPPIGPVLEGPSRDDMPWKLKRWSAALVARKSRFDPDPGLPTRSSSGKDARFSPEQPGFDSPASHWR